MDVCLWLNHTKIRSFWALSTRRQSGRKPLPWPSVSSQVERRINSMTYTNASCRRCRCIWWWCKVEWRRREWWRGERLENAWLDMMAQGYSTIAMTAMATWRSSSIVACFVGSARNQKPHPISHNKCMNVRRKMNNGVSTMNVAEPMVLVSLIYYY
jgi:hypothetical protein